MLTGRLLFVCIDRERLKGNEDVVPKERINKLKILLKIGAGMAGSVKRNDARGRTVGFAQIAQAMSLGGGSSPAAGGGAMSASAQKKFNELRVDKERLQRLTETQAGQLAEAEMAAVLAQEEVARQQEELETTRVELQGNIGKVKASLKATNGKLGKREEQLGKASSDFAVSKAEVTELKLRLEQVETRAGVERMRANEEMTELRAALGDRDRTISTLAIKCQRMEAEVSELQAAVVDLAVDERVIESEKARSDMEGKKKQTEEQVQKLRMEVASAKYMQTLYWENRKFADEASDVLEPPSGPLLDPALAAQQYGAF